MKYKIEVEVEHTSLYCSACKFLLQFNSRLNHCVLFDKPLFEANNCLDIERCYECFNAQKKHERFCEER